MLDETDTLLPDAKSKRPAVHWPRVTLGIDIVVAVGTLGILGCELTAGHETVPVSETHPIPKELISPTYYGHFILPHEPPFVLSWTVCADCDSIKGCYWYPANQPSGSTLPFEGLIRWNERLGRFAITIKVDLDRPGDSARETFEGYLNEEGAWCGTWESTTRTKRLPFELQETQNSQLKLTKQEHDTVLVVQRL